MMRYWGTGTHGWAWGIGILTSLIFWTLIIWAIVALVGWARRDQAGTADPGIGRGKRFVAGCGAAWVWKPVARQRP